MKLYFRPDTCALSPHIVLRELGIPFSPILVDRETKKTSDGEDFLEINPKGYVAALKLDNGEVLTEGPVIVLYLADLEPSAGLAPGKDTWERIRVQEWLSFISSELHAGVNPLFNSQMAAAGQAFFKERLLQRFGFLESHLGDRDYLFGDRFGVADAYLFTILGWMRFFDIDLKRWPAIAHYCDRIGSRSAVRAAIEFENAAKTDRS